MEVTSSCYVAFVLFGNRESQGGKECLVDGKKTLAESSWRLLWGGLACAGMNVVVVAVVAFEGCSQQQRKGSDSIRDAWGGHCFCKPCFGLLL